MAVLEILEQAFKTFDEGDYDSAVKAFFAAFVSSSDEQQKKDIYQVLFENFIRPNENEFRESYDASIELIRKNGGIKVDTIPSFDELPLKAIPVSDTRFYIWDAKNNKPFSGKAFDIDDYSDKEKDDIISSLLVDGITDMSVVLQSVSRHNYSSVFFAYRDNDALNHILSFFMIPKVIDFFSEPFVIFDDLMKFKEYMLDSGAYIPRIIKCPESYDYKSLMTEIHEERVHGKRKGDNVFLSICIPSWNRGKTALANVKKLRNLMYDEEIEIIVCNNGSTKELEYYKEIEKLAESDSRILYAEKPSRYYGDSFENIISLPNGEFALLNGDEDFMLIENFDAAIEWLYKNSDVGLHCFVTQTEDSSYYETDAQIIRDGFRPILNGIYGNYMTGLCYKMSSIKNQNLIAVLHEKYNKGDTSTYYCNYTHCVFNAYVAGDAGMAYTNITLFEDTVKDNPLYTEEGLFRYTYIFPENRVNHLKQQVEILEEMNLDEEALFQCTLNVCINLYRLFRCAYGYYMDIMMEKHSWEETCKIAYETHLEILTSPGIVDRVGEKTSKDMQVYASQWYKEQLEEPLVNYEDDKNGNVDYIEGGIL